MKNLLRWMVSFALLAAFPVMAATNGNPTAPLAGVTCAGTLCSGFPNDATHAWFFAPATGATFAVTGTFWQTTQPVSGTVTITPSGTQTVTGSVGISGTLPGYTVTPTFNLGTLNGAALDTSVTAITTKLNNGVGLLAGSAIVGKVGIDQTTPGTTNGVVVNSSALPPGAATAASQTNVQSAVGTPQTTAITVQGNASGVPVPVSGTVTTSPAITATQTTNTITPVAVGATSVTLIAANSSRKSLSFMNIGGSACTVTTVNPAVSGSGTVYASGGAFPSQGGSSQYDSKVPTNAYFAICPAGLSTTFSVEEGN